MSILIYRKKGKAILRLCYCLLDEKGDRYPKGVVTEIHANPSG